MLKLSKKKLLISLVTLSVLSFSEIKNSIAETIPQVYKFIPRDSFITFNIKTSEKSWYAITQNKSFKQLKLFSDFSKSKDFDILEDKQIRDNLGDNIVLSIPSLKLNPNKITSGNSSLTTANYNNNEAFIMAVEMKNKNKNSYMRTKIFNIYANKKETKIVESKYKEANIISVIPNATSDNNFKPAYYIFLNNYFIMTNDVKSVQDSIKDYYKPEMQLRTLSGFVKSYSKLGSDYQLQVYMDIKKLGHFVFDNNGSPELKSFKNNGIFSNDSILMNLNLSSKSIELRSYLLASKKSLPKISKKTSRFNLTNYLPKDAVAFMGIADFNPLEYISAINSKKNSQEINQSFKNDFGIDMKEFYLNLKGENAFTAFNTQVNPIVPGFAFILTPKDTAKMEKTLNSIKIDFDRLTKYGVRKKADNTKKGIMKFSEVKRYKDVKIVVTNEITSLDQFSIKPAYTFINNQVIIASNEEVIKSLIDRVKNNVPDFTLEKNQYFQSLKDILGKNNNTLGYINLDTIISMANTFNNDKSREISSMMSLLKKLHALGFNTLNDKDGTLSRIILFADIDKIDFNKMILNQNEKSRIDLNNSKSTYY